MKTNKMTNKMFLHRSNSKISAEAFLQQHREFLLSGELGLFTSPILSKLEEKELMPTPALEEVRKVVLAHHLAEETRKAEASMTRAQEIKAPKNYQGEIRSKDGLLLLEKGFETPQDCERWLDRNLVDGEPECFGICTASHVLDKEGAPLSVIIMRGDSIARVFRKGKSPVMKAQSKSAGKLSWGAKVKQSHASFSRG